MNDDQLMRQLDAMDHDLTDDATLRAARGRVWQRLRDERPALAGATAAHGAATRTRTTRAGRGGAIVGFRAGPSRGGWRAGLDMAAVAVLVLGLLFGAASRNLFPGSQQDGSTTTAAAASVPSTPDASTNATPAGTAEGTPSVDDNILNNRSDGSEQLPASAYNTLPDPSTYGTLWNTGYQPDRVTITGSELTATTYRYASTQGDRIEILVVDYSADQEGIQQAKLYAKSQIDTRSRFMYVYDRDSSLQNNAREVEPYRLINGCSDIQRVTGGEYQTGFQIGITSCLDETHHRLIVVTVSGFIDPSTGNGHDQMMQTLEASNYVVEQVIGYQPLNGTATPAA